MTATQAAKDASTTKNVENSMIYDLLLVMRKSLAEQRMDRKGYKELKETHNKLVKDLWDKSTGLEHEIQDKNQTAKELKQFKTKYEETCD